MNTTTKSRIRRTALAATAAVALTVAGSSSPSGAASASSLRDDCERAGGTFGGDGSIRPTCRDARVLSPFTDRAGRDCESIRGIFTLEYQDDWRRVSWQCDISRL